MRRAARPVAVVRRGARMVCQATTATKTVKIGTRGSPLALAQAYMTRDLLKVPGRSSGRGWQRALCRLEWQLGGRRRRPQLRRAACACMRERPVPSKVAACRSCA